MTKHVPRFSSTSYHFLAVLAFGSVLGRAAVLSMPSQAVANGQFLFSSVTYHSEGARVSGLQFDIVWPAGVEVQIAAGRGLSGAGKLLYSAQLGTSHLRILIAGGNGNILGDGEMVRLFVAVKGIDSSTSVELRDVLGATPEGDPFGIRAIGGVLSPDPIVPVIAVVQESVLNAASLLPGPLAPGEIVTLLGAFGIAANASPNIAATANHAPVTVLYAAGNQVNAILPLDMDPTKPVELELRNTSGSIGRIILPVVSASPALFTQSGSGIGSGAILNEDYSLNTPANPATAGSIVMMYGTAFGALNPPEGQLLPQTTVAVTATVGGLPADVIYAGAAPGLPDGVVQVNVRIPQGIGPSDSLAIGLRAGSFAIPDGVTLAAR